MLISCFSSLNPLVIYKRHNYHLSPDKAISIFQDYDLVLDCTDHPTSRYLISDACVLTGKALVSASALRTEGQLIVLNDPPQPPGESSGGPCYRCIFPKPPPAEAVLSCGEGGILGPVVGVMGVLQALEAIKVICRSAPTGMRNGVTNGDSEDHSKPTMLMFSAYTNPQFRSVRLRSRRANCAVCSSTPSITEQSLTSGSLDYVAFCGVTSPVDILPQALRISASEYAKSSKGNEELHIDVRDRTQFALCSLPHFINVPWTGSTDTWIQDVKSTGVDPQEESHAYVICRFGNDSQLAVQALIDHGSTSTKIQDIRGGFESWRKEVDPDWPDY